MQFSPRGLHGTQYFRFEVPGRGSALCAGVGAGRECEKGVRWMPWRQEAMKDVARCEKPRGDASDR